MKHKYTCVVGFGNMEVTAKTSSPYWKLGEITFLKTCQQPSAPSAVQQDLESRCSYTLRTPKLQMISMTQFTTFPKFVPTGNKCQLFKHEGKR